MKIADLAKQPLVVGIVAFLLGLIVGLPVLGWYVFPVQWTDADFASLRRDQKLEYARLVAVSYAADLDAQRAGQAIVKLGPDWEKVVTDATTAATGADATRLTTLNQVLQAQASAGQLSTTPAKPAAGGLGGLLLPLTAACVVVLLLGGGGFLFLRSRSGSAASPGRAPARKPAAESPAGAEAASGGAAVGAEAAPAGAAGAQPIQRFLTTYTLGDDVYDDSFSVDGPDGNFLGECGMGISETIGVGDPKKVTAFEVWLFDKNDIRTVTKVIMSEHAFKDEALKSRLAAKGEPVQAQSGETVSLETATLIVTARVVDMAYGGGALPPNSFFERVTIELQAYRKPAAAA